MRLLAAALLSKPGVCVQVKEEVVMCANIHPHEMSPVPVSSHLQDFWPSA